MAQYSNEDAIHVFGVNHTNHTYFDEAEKAKLSGNAWAMNRHLIELKSKGVNAVGIEAIANPPEVGELKLLKRIHSDARYFRTVEHHANRKNIDVHPLEESHKGILLLNLHHIVGKLAER